MDERPTFGSLFAGIGGIDLGLERAGWRGRWQVEWDEWCRDRLADRWPDLIRYGDITDVDWATVEPVDLLAGGFPCQPVSAAGRQAAQADARWLWPEFHRAICDLRPRLVLVENVPNLLAVGDGSAFGDVLGDLAASGYDTEWDCIPAAAVGAPHERDRVFLVAYPESHRLGAAWDADRDAGDIGERGQSDVADAGRGRLRPDDRARQARPADGAAQGEARQRQRGGDDAGGRGQTMADSDGIGRQGERSGGLSSNGDASRWYDPNGRGGPLAHANGSGQRSEQRDDDARQPDPARGGSVLADAYSARLQGRVFHPERGGEWFAGPRGVVDSARSGLPESEISGVRETGQPGPERGGAHRGGPTTDRGAQPGLGGDSDGLSHGLDHCWPAPPGPQYDWEPPRTVAGRIPDRTRRLKACGNAVVPQVVEPIGRWLLEALT